MGDDEPRWGAADASPNLCVQFPWNSLSLNWETKNRYSVYSTSRNATDELPFQFTMRDQSVKKYPKTPVTPCGRNICGRSYFVGNTYSRSLSVKLSRQETSIQIRGGGYRRKTGINRSDVLQSRPGAPSMTQLHRGIRAPSDRSLSLGWFMGGIPPASRTEGFTALHGGSRGVQAPEQKHVDTRGFSPGLSPTTLAENSHPRAQTNYITMKNATSNPLFTYPEFASISPVETPRKREKADFKTIFLYAPTQPASFQSLTTTLITGKQEI